MLPLGPSHGQARQCFQSGDNHTAVRLHIVKIRMTFSPRELVFLERALALPPVPNSSMDGVLQRMSFVVLRDCSLNIVSQRLRWHHEKHGIVLPCRFDKCIGLAGASGGTAQADRLGFGEETVLCV
jgi:hypothetical protein